MRERKQERKIGREKLVLNKIGNKRLEKIRS